jgi:hypothetical protein
MNHQEVFRQNVDRVGWGLLAILWGATILFDFVPFSIGLMGTGLILLGAQAALRLNQIPATSNNVVLGVLTLAWGVLELGRHRLRQVFPSADLDWVIFAVLLIGWGLILLTRVLWGLRDRHGVPFAGAREE